MPKRRRPSSFEGLETRQLLHGVVDLSINFAPKHVPGVAGMIADVGEAYGDRGDGMYFGWNVDNSANARDRNKTSDQRLDTLAMLQTGGNRTWEMALPDGDYTVTITAGDAKYFDSVNVINAEGSNVVKNTPSRASWFATRTRVVTVSDGRLTIRAGSGASKAEINSIRIQNEDDDGDDGDEQPATITATAVDATATEGSADPGTIRLIRDGGNANAALTIGLAWSGSAGTKKDLSSSLPTSATFAVGQTVIDLPVVAKLDGIDEAAETVKLTLRAGAGYTLGSSATASVEIVSADTAIATPDATLENLAWTSTTAPPTSFSETMRAVVNGKLYLFGGFDGAFVAHTSIYRFDGASWQTLGETPVAFTHAGTAVVDDTVWFAGGYLGNGTEDQTFGTTAVRYYNTTSGTWTDAPALPSDRAAGSLVKVGRTLFFFGGEDANRDMDSTAMWSLDLGHVSRGWTSAAAMPLARNHATAVTLGSKIFVLGGQTGHDDALVTHDDIQVYDATTGTWTVSSKKLPAARSHTTNSTVLYDGWILMIGGESSHNVAANQVWAIDPTTLDTRVFGTFADARSSATAGVLDGKVYTFGGYRSSTVTTGFVGVPAALPVTPTPPVTPPVTPMPPSQPTQPTAPATLTNITWAATTSALAPHTEAQTAVVGGKFYRFGGYNGNYSATRRVERFDVATKTWVRMSDMPVGLSHAGTAIVGTKVWFAGAYAERVGSPGQQDIGVRNVWIYDTTNDTWTAGPALPAARGSGGLANVNNVLYFISGEEAGDRADMTTVWAYDLSNPSAGWVTKAPIPEGRSHFGCVVLNSKVYCFGGQVNHDAASTMLKSSYVYDPAANTWTRLADMPTPMSHLAPASVAYKGKIYSFGGDYPVYVASTQAREYDPATNTWRLLNNLPVARAALVAGVVGDTFIISGGKDRAEWTTDTFIGTVV